MTCRITPARLLAAIFAALLSWGAALAEPIPVVVSIAPQKFFVEQIAGPLASVTVLVAPGADPHTYEPKPSQMASVAKARLYMAQGVEFEEVWLAKLAKSNPNLTLVDTCQGIERMPMAEHEEHHARGKHEEHELDPHVWTAPPLVKIQAVNMTRALSQADPANAHTYAANLAVFEARLDALDARLRAALAGVAPGARFMVFHPAWAYFARQYDLVEVPIETGGKEPGPRQLQKLVEQAKSLGVKVIFVQPQFSEKTARTVAQAIGAGLVKADDLAANWEDNLLAVAMAFKDAVR